MGRQLKKLQDIGEHHLNVKLLSSQAQSLIEQGKFEQAFPVLLQALDSAHARDLNALVGGLYDKISHAYHTTRQFKKALEYKERAELLQAHLLNEKRLQAIDELEIRYRTAEKERLLALAENENLKKSRQLAQSRWIITLLVLGLLVALLIARNFQQKKKVAQLVAVQNQMRHSQELAQLQKEKDLAAMRALFSGQEQERKRIANDLHDSLGGLLYSLQLLLTKAGPNEKAMDIVRRAVAENRRISENLLPPALTRLGLVPALEEWAKAFQKNWSLPVELHVEAPDILLSDEIKISVFRIAQELMNNAARHAQASNLTLQLYTDDDALHLLVEDDGQGFDQEAASPLLLKTVISRTQLLNGELHIDSMPGRGTTVMVKIPLSVE